MQAYRLVIRIPDLHTLTRTLGEKIKTSALVALSTVKDGTVGLPIGFLRQTKERHLLGNNR